jgi:DNA polymerase-1
LYFQLSHVAPRARAAAGRVITTVAEWWQCIEFLEKQDLVVLDYETSGLKWYRGHRPVGAALACMVNGKPWAIYAPFGHWTPEQQLPEAVVVEGLRRILENPRIAKMCWNIIFEKHMSRMLGLTIVGPQRDGLIEAHLWDENQLKKGLKTRAVTDLGDKSAATDADELDEYVVQAAKHMRCTKTAFLEQYGYAPLPVSVVGPYACMDGALTCLLGGFYDSKSIRTDYAETYQTEIDLTDVVVDMEARGMPLDRKYIEVLHDRLLTDQKKLEQKIFAECGTFRIGSQDELRWILQNSLKLQWTKLTKASMKQLRELERSIRDEWHPVLSVDDEVLMALAHHNPICKDISDWRAANTLITRYTYSLFDYCGPDDVLHGEFVPLGTNTGRFASKNPNMQNAASDSDERAQAYSGKKLEDGGIDPWSVKRIFIIPDDWLRGFHDYSQIELRVLAEESGDPVMLNAYANDEDIHTRTSMEVFGTKEKAWRRLAKIINFGLSYCMSAPGFARQAGIEVEEAEKHLDKFFQKYPRIAPFRSEFWAACQKQQGYFRNRFGRPRRVPDICMLTIVWRMRRAQRMLIGSLIQGTAAELTKASLVRIHKLNKKLGLGLHICSTIHDEIQIDYPLPKKCNRAQRREVEEKARLVVAQMESYGHKFRKVRIVAESEKAESGESWADKRKWHLHEKKKAKVAA